MDERTCGVIGCELDDDIINISDDDFIELYVTEHEELEEAGFMDNLDE